jgi:hypothetical protein
MPHPLIAVAWLSLTLAVLSALTVVADLVVDGAQTMWIMNVVWPVTALWAGPLGLLGYLRYGRAGSRRAAEREDRAPPGRRQPFSILVAKGTSHCGSGCTVGDLVAESIAFAFPLTLFGQRFFGVWIYDYALAYLFGIAFQYYTIKPMQNQGRHSLTHGLADRDVRLDGGGAICDLRAKPVDERSGVLAHDAGGNVLRLRDLLPVNWWLLRRGIKEAM